MAVYRSPFGADTGGEQDIFGELQRQAESLVAPSAPAPAVGATPVAPVAPVVPASPTAPVSTVPMRGLLDIAKGGGGGDRPSAAGPKAAEARTKLQSEVTRSLTELAQSGSSDSGAIAKIRGGVGDIASSAKKQLSPFGAVASSLKQFLPDSWVEPFAEGGEGALRWLGYGVSTPLRIVESAAKELSDVVGEDKASLIEFLQQSFDPDFQPVYTPVESFGSLLNQDWSENGFVNGLDTFFTFTGKIAADPITYVTFTPMTYSGQGGRAALADEVGALMQRSGYDDATRAGVMADVYRYGEFGMPTDVRNLMVSSGKFDPSGVRWMGAVIPKTGRVASEVGMGLSSARAQIGDTASGLAAKITPQERLGLVGVARGTVRNPSEVLGAFATYSANKRAGADAAMLVNSLASKYKATMREAAALGPEQQRDLVDFMEGVSTAIDPNLLPLATQLRQAYDETLQRYNELRAGVSDEYFLNLPQLPRLDNYVHRTLTREARAASKSPLPNRVKQWNRIKRELSVAPEQIERNEGFTMARTGGKTFLGEELENNSIGAYNEIAERVLGYKLFEENAGQIFKNYLDQIGKQARRELFVDQLFKVYPQGIKRFIAGAPTPKAVSAAVDELENSLDAMISTVFKSTKTTPSTRAEVLEQVKQVKDALAAQGADAFKESARVTRVAKAAQTKLRKVYADLVAAERRAVDAGTDAVRAYDLVAAPLKARINELSAALDQDKSAYDAAMEWLLQKHKLVFPDASTRPSTAEGLADEILGNAQANLRGAARRSVETKTQAARAAGARAKRDVTVGGETLRVSAAKKQLEKASVELRKAERIFSKRVASDPAVKGLKSQERMFNRAAASFDVAAALAGTRDQWEEVVGVVYRSELDEVRELLTSVPKVSDGYEANVQWLNKVQSTLDEIQALDIPEGQKDILDRVFTQLFAEEGHLAKIEATELDLSTAKELERLVAENLMQGAWVPDLEDGWKALKNLHVQISPEIAAQVDSIYKGLSEEFMEKLKDPSYRGVLADLYRQATAYFKSTALLTVGYTVRNAVTAAYNNAVLGVTPEQMGRGTSFAYDVWRYGLDEAFNRIEDVTEREMMRQAYRAFQMGGGSTVLDEVIPRVGRSAYRYSRGLAGVGMDAADRVFRPFGGRVSASARQLNENVEMAMRMGMAINGIERGLDPLAAGARIARVQFDYTQLSKLDETMKMFIPFWTFASRNIPLQMVNQVLRPGYYQAYDRMVEAGGEYDEGIPFWRARTNPVRLPFGNWYLDLDLPFQNVATDIEEITSARGLVGMSNPFIRFIPEMIYGERIAFGETIPYSEEYRKAGITDIPALPFFAQGAGGNLMVQPSKVEPIMGLLPALQNIQRYGAALTGAVGQDEGPARDIIGGPQRVFDRSGVNVLTSALGLGAYELADRDIANEYTNRYYDLRDYMEELRQLGYIKE